jgi:threonyl-tRNA synthetase
MERFAATLIEHYAGAFPTWLSPIEVTILPIADRHVERALELEKQLREADIRVKVDTNHESINHKIREAQLAKIPYMLVIGDKELESGTVAVRSRSRSNLGVMSFDTFFTQLLQEIKSYGRLEVGAESTPSDATNAKVESPTVVS